MCINLSKFSDAYWLSNMCMRGSKGVERAGRGGGGGGCPDSFWKIKISEIYIEIS